MEVQFPDPGQAAVRVDFPGGGSGRPVQADRLDLVLGLLAWGVHGTDESQVRGAADRIRPAATAIAASPDGALPPGAVSIPTRSRGEVDLALVEWVGGRSGGVTMELARSSVGPVPVRAGSPGGSTLIVAGLAAAAWEALHLDAEGRLALALALEGLTAWYHDAHRLTPARDAVQSARLHAADRMREAGHLLPPSLAGEPG